MVGIGSQRVVGKNGGQHSLCLIDWHLVAFRRLACPVWNWGLVCIKGWVSPSVIDFNGNMCPDYIFQCDCRSVWVTVWPKMELKHQCVVGTGGSV